MFQRVRIRLTLITVILFVCLYSVSAASVFGWLRHQVMQGIYEQLNATAMQLELQPLRAREIPQEREIVYVSAGLGISWTNDPDLANNLQKLTPPHNARSLQPFNWTAPGGHVYRMLYMPPQYNSPLSIYVGIDISTELAVLTPLLQILLTVGLIGTGIAVIGGFYLAERALRPIRAAWQRQVEFVLGRFA